MILIGIGGCAAGPQESIADESYIEYGNLPVSVPAAGAPIAFWTAPGERFAVARNDENSLFCHLKPVRIGSEPNGVIVIDYNGCIDGEGGSTLTSTMSTVRVDEFTLSEGDRGRSLTIHVNDERLSGEYDLSLPLP